ncbi:hypothetical protein PAXRUDRAFT_164844 [Paxillus rubicundulus Ve08.2h10]|uniref:Uncharacterized protein n=1 Tax=Paxillus rubicundulus Ve08.2h10 TaxID=930991 RepID=A0A0D0DBV5_9AGAM|nr:hypothetical protein PAXRUDRAFT_164844 [Paxillus rubicundulus Ve08.2h10]
MHTATTIGENPEKPRNLFDWAAFTEAIIQFIIVDNQVGLLVWNYSFISLALCRASVSSSVTNSVIFSYHEDLQDIDIPRWMKLQELIIGAWKAYFNILKKDLAVSIGRISFMADVWSDSLH